MPPFIWYNTRKKGGIFMLNLCDIAEVKPLLARHGFHFSKSKGQNFLIAPWVPKSIVEESGVDDSCGVLEVGPGIGPLTQQLCLKAGKVTAVEVDESLKPILAETLGEFSNCHILWKDITKVNIRALAEQEFAGLRPMACANLPYYITTPILTALLEAKCFSSVTVMVQKEAAQRMTARPGTDGYGLFTVLCNYYAEPRLLFDVPPSCFLPQPKVNSAVMQLVVRENLPWEVKDEELFFRVVKATFAQRRKTLQNSLSSGFSEISKARLGQLLEDCGYAPTVRGESLETADYAKIANRIWEEIHEV